MLTQIINARILTPQGWLKDGSVLIRDHKILEVTNCDLAVIGAKLIDAKGMYIVPGGVEIHVHGGGGRDFMEGTEDAFRTAIKAHMQHGTTSIFPTLSSSTIPMIPVQPLHVCAARRIVIPGPHGSEHIRHGSRKKQPLFCFWDIRQQNQHSVAIPIGNLFPSIQDFPRIAEYFPKAAASNPVRKLSYPQQDIRKFYYIVLKPGLFRRRIVPLIFLILHVPFL